MCAARKTVDLLVTGAAELATPEGRRGRAGEDFGRIAVRAGHGVACDGGRIVAIAPDAELRASYSGRAEVDAAGGVVLPGLVDAHTHPVFATTREAEFEQRMAGATYVEIAASGGGIRSSLAGVRAASAARLTELLLGRLDRFLALGTTTIEAKTGYGLTVADELKGLDVIAAADRAHAVDLVATCLGAHSVPPEFTDDPARWERVIIEELWPAAASRARFADVFTEAHVFGLDASRRLMQAAQDVGLGVRMHVDQLTPLGGAELAAELGAASADHLEHVTPRGIEALARAGVVPVLCPLVPLYLREQQEAPARRMVRGGLAPALSTDFNPGSCYCMSLFEVMSFAALRYGFSAAEALTGATLNAAASLGLAEDRGSLEVGKRADIVVTDLPNHHHLTYEVGRSPVATVVKDGRVAWRRAGLVVCAALACLAHGPVAHAAQTEPPVEPPSSTAAQPSPDATTGAREDAPDLALHAAGVLAERRAALAQAWRASTDEGRDAARAWLLARKSLGPAALLSPPERVLAEATRLARGDVAPGAPYPGLVALADALDLRVVPGALAAGRETDSTVHFTWVQPPLHPDVPELVALRLAVVSAALPGRADLTVTPCAAFQFAPRGLGLAGVELPVKLPALEAGEHWLAFELEHAGHVVPGFFVPLEVVANLDERLAARPVPKDAPLDRLLRFGVRAEGRGSLAAWFSGERTSHALAPQAVAGAAGVALLGVDLDHHANDTLFIDVPPPGDPAGWFAGDEGLAWVMLGAGSTRLVALRMDLAPGDGPDPLAGTALGVIATVAAVDPTSARVLVVRGDRLPALAPLLERGGETFQALVVIGAPQQGIPRGWRGVATDGGRAERATLLVECLADADSPAEFGALPPLPEGGGRFVRVTRRAPPCVVPFETAILYSGLQEHLAAPWLGASPSVDEDKR